MALPGDNTYEVPAPWRTTLEKRIGAGEVILGFRPEAAHSAAEGELHGNIYADDLHGSFAMLHLTLAGGEADSMVHVRAERSEQHRIGEHLRFNLDPTMVRFFDPRPRRQSGRRVTDG